MTLLSDLSGIVSLVTLKPIYTAHFSNLYTPKRGENKDKLKLVQCMFLTLEIHIKSFSSIRMASIGYSLKFSQPKLSQNPAKPYWD